MKIIKVLSGLAFVLCTVVLVLSLTGRLFWKSHKYAVTINNLPGKAVTTYASRNAILLDLRSLGDEEYVIYPQKRQVGVVDVNPLIDLHYFVVSPQSPVIYVPIAKRIEAQTHEQFRANSVMFLSASGNTVVISW